MALDDVSLEVAPGETVAVVGRSAAGKSTLVRSIVGLVRPTSGDVEVGGQPLVPADRHQLRRLRRSVHLVFQDPRASLDPRMAVGDLLVEPYRIHRLDPRPPAELLELVGLGTEHLVRFPHELSGGQLQRVCIARALALGPRLLLTDEATSSLDASIRAQVLSLLSQLQSRLHFAHLLVTHDLTTVAHIADRVVVLDQGRVVEAGDVESALRSPVHPATRALVAAVGSVPGEAPPSCPPEASL